MATVMEMMAMTTAGMMVMTTTRLEKVVLVGRLRRENTRAAQRWWMLTARKLAKKSAGDGRGGG